MGEEPELGKEAERYQWGVVRLTPTHSLGSGSSPLEWGWTLFDTEVAAGERQMAGVGLLISPKLSAGIVEFSLVTRGWHTRWWWVGSDGRCLIDLADPNVLSAGNVFPCQDGLATLKKAETSTKPRRWVIDQLPLTGWVGIRASRRQRENNFYSEFDGQPMQRYKCGRNIISKFYWKPEWWHQEQLCH